MVAIPHFKLAATSGLVGFAGMIVALCATSTHAEDPATLLLTGTVRDFREKTDPEGHPDFESRPDMGFGRYSGNVAAFLSDEGKPVFTGNGKKVTVEWADAAGRPICNCQPPMPGDVPGTMTVDSTGGILSAESFNQWFNDDPGMNLSSALTLTFNRTPDGTYVFDDKDDTIYGELGGFFPIEDQLFGNPGGTPDRNFHFTYELAAEFTYHTGADQIFRFIGDDDVWVFVNGQLVIDLGGVHSAKEQFIEMDRLELEDGEVYPLHFFFAERHRTASNFRIETNLVLHTINVPEISAAFD